MTKLSLYLVAVLAMTGACGGSNATGPGASNSVPPLPPDSSATCVETCAASEARIAELTERLERLEAAQKRFSEIDGFVRPIMVQQREQADQRDAYEHDPDARFAVDITGNQFEGPAGAAVTIVEAFDFACPYCERVSPILEGLVKQYKGQIRVVYKNFIVHPDTATDAHLAGCAAGMQGKFSQFKRLYWEKGFGTYRQTRDAAAMGRDALQKMASTLRLDTKKFTRDMDGEACKQRMKSDMTELGKFRVNGTPSFFINGRFTSFATEELFKAMIDAELQEVASSGVPANQYYQKVVLEQGEKSFRSIQDGQAD